MSREWRAISPRKGASGYYVNKFLASISATTTSSKPIVTRSSSFAKVDSTATYDASSLENVSLSSRTMSREECSQRVAKKARSGREAESIKFYSDDAFDPAFTLSTSECNLLELPDVTLARMAEFLTKTERALAAVAMTAPAHSWRDSKYLKPPSSASKIIVAAKPLREVDVAVQQPKWPEKLALENSYQWDFVDFEDIDKSVAAKLTDEDIGGVLVCIDAVNTIKKLKLRGCYHIDGHGLEPLRGSSVLESIDLSLVGADNGVDSSNESPDVFPPPDISFDSVASILESIIDNDESSLKHIQLPKKWRMEQGGSLARFLSKYNQMLDGRHQTCCYRGTELGCNDPPCGKTCNAFVPEGGHFCGIQQFTCYQCNNWYCLEHIFIYEEVCEMCEKIYCMDCNRVATCKKCSRTSCRMCTNIEQCEVCERDLCGDCAQVCWCDCCGKRTCADCCPFLFCEHGDCSEGNCIDCSERSASSDEGDNCDQVKFCTSCDSAFCPDHLVGKLSCHEENSFSCGDCEMRCISMVKQRNSLILDQFHAWGEQFQYSFRNVSEMFNTHLQSNDLNELMDEQRRMKHWWEHLLSKSTAEQRQGAILVSKMFLV